MLTKKFLPIFCLISVLFLTGCDAEPAVPTLAPTAVVDESEPAVTAVPETELPPTAEPEAVESADRIEIPLAGFSVVPPSGYSVDLDDPEGIQMLADGATEETGPMIAIFGGEFDEEMTADQMYEFIVGADETLGDVERLPYENSNGDGFVAEFVTMEEDTIIKGRIALTLLDGQGTLVTAIALGDDWDDGFGTIVDEVQASIEHFQPADS